jgi:hypothetical protein
MLLNAGIRIALTGHAAAIFPTLCTALESACYAYRMIEDEKLEKMWADRHQNAESAPLSKTPSRRQLTMRHAASTPSRPAVAPGSTTSISQQLTSVRIRTTVNSLTPEILAGRRRRLAVLSGLTIVHYWVERYIWRFNIPARRTWIEKSFSFLQPAIRHARPPARRDATT